MYDDVYINMLRLVNNIMAHNYLHLQDNKYLMIKKYDE